jgi:hypothetical protein
MLIQFLVVISKKKTFGKLFLIIFLKYKVKPRLKYLRFLLMKVNLVMLIEEKI